GVPCVPQLVGDDEIGLGHSRLDVTDTVRRDAGDVVRPRVVHTGRRLESLQRRRDGGHRLVLDVGGIEGGLEPRGLPDDDNRHRLADVPGFPERQPTLVEGPYGRPERKMGWNWSRDLGKLGRTEDPEDTRKRAGLRRIDADHPRVSVRAAHDPQVHQSWPRDVVEIPSGSLEEREVLAGLHRESEHLAVGRHQRSPRYQVSITRSARATRPYSTRPMTQSTKIAAMIAAVSARDVAKTIRYPSPACDVMNSPTIAPMMDSVTAILRPLKM